MSEQSAAAPAHIPALPARFLMFEMRPGLVGRAHNAAMLPEAT